MTDSASKPKRPAGTIEPAVAERLRDLVAYGEGAVVSRTLAKGPRGTLTVFAFDAGQELSEHSSPFDAWVLVLEGEVNLAIGGTPVRAREGEVVLMPANVPHAVKAPARFKMLLVLLENRTDPAST